MFINKNSLIINGINMGQYLTECEYQYNKLWSSDSGRNLAGTQTGTLVGIFPKIVCSFRKLTQSELQTLAPIFDSSTQSVTYYDPNKRQNKTMTTYTGDWSVINKRVGKNESFKVSFIARSKRQ